MNKRISFVPIFFFLIPFQLSAQFMEQVIMPPGLLNASYSSVVWGDYDNDGKLDILISGREGSKIYHNNGGNSFTDIGWSMPGLSYSDVAWGDYDNDGDLDLVITGFLLSGATRGNISKIYRNDAGVFNGIESELIGISRGSVAWGDYDNDGDLDLLLAGDTTGSGHHGISRIYRNMEGSVFKEQTSIVLVNITAGASAAWADYNRDGKLDFILAGYTGEPDGTAVSKIYKNMGGNVFEEQVSIMLAGMQASSVAWGDYDNDGDPDLLLTGLGRAKLYKNNYLSNTFSEVTVMPVPLAGITHGDVAWGDYDNDGKLDIFLCGTESGSHNISKVYRNMGGNTFIEQNIVPVPLTAYNVGGFSLGDYDNDSTLDILLTGRTESGLAITKIFKNTTDAPNNPPSKPTDLAVSITDGIATFHWTKSHDDHTIQDALHYNLVIGTSFGAVNKLSPMANLGDGSRRVVALGNTNYMNSWAIEGISGGILGRTYYYGVQAIDNSYAGSEFNMQKIYVKGLLEKNWPVLITIAAVIMAAFYFILKKRKKKPING